MKLQRIGKALMLPIAVFPAAAILTGCGHALEATYIRELHAIALLLQSLGNAILQQMPMLFAISVAYFLSNDKHGVTALNGLLCFIIITSLLSNKNVSFLVSTTYRVDTAFSHINNQFIGILCGLIAAFTYNRGIQIKTKKIPSIVIVFAFSCIVMLLVSYLFYFIWPMIFSTLIYFGEQIQHLGPLGAGIYAFFNRLLIPIGMHHMLNSIFWFDVIGINDIGNFWSSQGTLGVSGMYQAGFYPIMMFGVPAMALAMLKTSLPKNKKKIKPFLLSVAFASFFTGVTEPLEFSFMFIAPWLYVIHACITGIVMFIAAQFQWLAGFSFSAGAIDYVLSYQLPLAMKPYMLLILGVIVFILYYFLFIFLINKFNLHTPGREEVDPLLQTKLTTVEINQIIKQIIEACGGSNNIIQIHSCITRLRIELKDAKVFKFKKIKKTGAISYTKIGNEIQIIYGAQVDYIMDILQDYQL